MNEQELNAKVKGMGYYEELGYRLDDIIEDYSSSNWCSKVAITSFAMIACFPIAVFLLLLEFSRIALEFVVLTRFWIVSFLLVALACVLIGGYYGS